MSGKKNRIFLFPCIFKVCVGSAIINISRLQKISQIVISYVNNTYDEILVSCLPNLSLILPNVHNHVKEHTQAAIHDNLSLSPSENITKTNNYFLYLLQYGIPY